MLMQAYDFLYLNKEYKCSIQWGGADQWGNIVAGSELGRKMNFIDNKNRTMVGVTNPLLLTPEGKKMGKTEKGAIWIDNEKISAYDFYQGVYQTPDACVEMMFAIFTDVPMDEVRELIKTDIVSAKKRMAYEITKFIRNEQDAIDAQNMSENLFNGSQNMDNAPTVTLNAGDVAENIPVLDLLVQVDFVKSKGEGRRLIDQKGISMNNEVITNAFATISKAELLEGVLFKKGKKNFIKVIAK